MKFFVLIIISLISAFLAQSCSTSSNGTTIEVNNNLDYSNSICGLSSNGIFKLQLNKFFKDTIADYNISTYNKALKYTGIFSDENNVYCCNWASSKATIIKSNKSDMAETDTIVISPIDSVQDIKVARGGYYLTTKDGLYMYNPDSSLAGYIYNGPIKQTEVAGDSCYIATKNALKIIDFGFNKVVDSISVNGISKIEITKNFIYTKSSLDSINSTIQKFNKYSLLQSSSKTVVNSSDFVVIEDSLIYLSSNDSMSTTVFNDQDSIAFDSNLKMTSTEKNIIMYSQNSVYILSKGIGNYSFIPLDGNIIKFE